MEREFEAKVRLMQRQRSSASGKRSSISFRAPQENFTADDFIMGELYGVGSYSKVMRAKKKDTGDVYALKIMDKQFITKENKASHVKLERIVLDQLDHPGVVRLYFTFQDNFFLYMALESCDGGELFDLITRKGQLPEDEARFYAAEIVDTLEYIHGQGLIHRDIKPENLLLTEDGHIKIADFGSVKPTMSTRITVPPDTNDKEGTFVGTAAYVPPESLNSSQATYGNDLWALGCTLYQMLSGSSPFKDASDWLIFQRIIIRDLTFPKYFSDEASDLIDKLLDKDPSKRLGTGLDGYAALKFHPFFKGIDWKNLWKSPPPKCSQESDAHHNDGGSHDDTQNHQNAVCDENDAADAAASLSSSSSDAHPTLAKLGSIDSFDSRWQDFLEIGESIVMTSAVKKINTLTSKKVQLILTDKPKLITVDPNKLWKRKVLWTGNPNDLNVQVANSTQFKIYMLTKVRSFEDAKERAWLWKKAVEGLAKN